MLEKHLTIEEAAAALGVSKDTVRRKIKRGDLQATKAQGPYGEQYFIPEREIDTVLEIKDVVPVKREMDPQELAALFQRAIEHANQPLQQALEAALTQLDKQGKDVQTLRQEYEAVKNALQQQEEARRAAEAERDALIKKLGEQGQDLAEKVEHLVTKSEERDAEVVGLIRAVLKKRKEEEARVPFWRRLFKGKEKQAD